MHNKGLMRLRARWLVLLLLCWAAAAGAGTPRLAEVERLLAQGQRGQALELLQRDAADNGLNPHNAWALLHLQAQQGLVEPAMETLARMVAEGLYAPADWLEKSAALAPLHPHPRWPALIAQARSRDALQQRIQGAAAIETPYREQLPLAERLAGVSRLWSEVKYNFANFDLVPGLDWDAVYLRTLEQVRHTPRTLDYYQELMRMVATLQDGHSGVYPPEALWNKVWAAPALRTQRVEGRVLITEVLDPGLLGQGLAPGQELLSIDGWPVEARARRQAPLISASTPQDRQNRLYGRELLAGDQARPLRLGLRDAAGRQRQLTLRREPVDRFYELSARPPFEWRMLPEEVALVRLNGFDDDSAADAYLKAFDQIAKARAIVFDLRANGGGNSSVGYRILATLADKPVASSRWWTRSHVSAWRAWGQVMPREGGSHGEIAPDPQRHYAGRIAVLTGAGTYSAAEDFVAAFKSLGRGPVVGELTGGSTGQPLFFKLPGGGQARICVKRDLLADGSEFVGKGIAPDLPASPTLAGWRAGRDEVLEAALRALR